MPGLRNTKLLRAALILFGIVIAIAVGEILVRALDIGPKPLAPLDVNGYQLSENKILRFEYQPNYRSPPGEPAFDVNSFGFRDREFTLTKPEGITRILVIGDSVTAGNGITNTNDTYPKVLETLLNEAAGAERFEIFNMGVGGYETIQEVEFLRQRGVQFQPDYVLIGFCINDFWSFSDGETYTSLLEANKITGDSVRIVPKNRPLLTHSRLAFLSYYSLRALASPPETSVAIPLGDENVVEGLKALHQLSRDVGFQALVFIIPAFDRPFDNYRYQDVHDKLRYVNQNTANLPLIDLKEDFSRLEDYPGPLAFDDLHPNKKGHRLIAEFLLARLRGSFPELLRK